MRAVSLRTELLLGLAVMATAAILLALIPVLLFENLVGHPYGSVLLGLIILGDVGVFVLFGAVKLRALVLQPLDAVVAATEAIAGGDLTRRVEPGTVTEFARLAASVNGMTGRLLEEQALVARFERMAGVGRLAAGVANELGAPLSAIHGYIHLVRRHAAADPHLEPLLGGIEHEGARIERILHGMLDYARPRHRCTAAVDVSAVAREVLAGAAVRGELGAVSVRMELDDALPAVHGDAAELGEAVGHLVRNAVEAMRGEGTLGVVAQRVPLIEVLGETSRRDGDSTHVHVSRDPSPRVLAWMNQVGDPGEVIKLVVADSGPGVAWSDSERIFDPFVTSKAPGLGTGLGLAIVSRTVESMGGTVWVRPAREGGAAFMILLPVQNLPA